MLTNCCNMALNLFLIIGHRHLSQCDEKSNCCIYMCMFMHFRMDVSVCVSWLYTCMHTSVCVCVCVCVWRGCMCLYVCLCGVEAIKSKWNCVVNVLVAGTPPWSLKYDVPSHPHLHPPSWICLATFSLDCKRGPSVKYIMQWRHDLHIFCVDLFRNQCSPCCFLDE